MEIETPFNKLELKIDTVNWPLFLEKGITVKILRTDLIDPVVSGNKWFKLRYYLEEARALNKKTILTFGGAWSNHIVATAAACQKLGFESVGVIRGEESHSNSITLKQASEFEMKLEFASRSTFSEIKRDTAKKNNDTYIIPEGGYGILGANGASTILNNINLSSFTHLICAVGTGTMLAGLINADTNQMENIGISSMKNNFDLEKEIEPLLADKSKKWKLLHGFDHGGFAKYSPALIEFMNEFHRKTDIPTDIVYTGKLCYALNQLANEDYFKRGNQLLVIHSGGLQGNRSLESGLLQF
jgi:1-aminocyclopropane-1-carboxylate deaminase